MDHSGILAVLEGKMKLFAKILSGIGVMAGLLYIACRGIRERLRR